jgi:hypothetical protein
MYFGDSTSELNNRLRGNFTFGAKMMDFGDSHRCSGNNSLETVNSK